MKKPSSPPQKHPLPSHLYRAICGVMFMGAMTAHASDIEIYQSSKNSNVTLMLMVDVSGSMNLANTLRDDYNLRSGNGPQFGNDNIRIATPIMDELAKNNTYFALIKNAGYPRYPDITDATIFAKNFQITNWGKYTARQAYAEYIKYHEFSPNSYCQGVYMTKYRVKNPPNPYRAYWDALGDAPADTVDGWIPTMIDEPASTYDPVTNPYGRPYARQYCRVPVDATTLDSKYWTSFGGTSVGSSWIMNPDSGCKMFNDLGKEVTQATEATHRRCYARMSRVKDALWEVLKGNPDKGIAPLGDDISVGISTLGLQLRNKTSTGAWSLENPLNSILPSTLPSVADNLRYRQLGAIRFPAQPLGDEVTVNGTKMTHRDHLLTLLQDVEVFDALGATPTARSYAESAAYMLGTTTQDDHNVYETDLWNTANGAHRVCVAWNNGTTISHNSLNIIPCTEWAFANETAFRNGDVKHIDGYKIAADRFTGKHRRHTETGNYRNVDELLGIPRNTGVIYYGSKTPSGLVFSDKSTKNDDGTGYKQPDSIANQTHPECSGQGIYALSDGMPSTLLGEENQMKLALGSKGSQFSCGVAEGSGLIQDWRCMWGLSEALLDPAKNPSGRVIKTAAVGFAREYAQGGLTPYDASKTTQENLDALKDSSGNAIPEEVPAGANENTRALITMANFARWGIKGGGGWYAGASTQDVVNSINSFVQSLTTDIPTVATGQPFIPIDPLNRLAYMDHAYYGSFTPEVANAKRFWSGDMNKYLVKNQLLLGQSDSPLFNSSTGLINTATIGYWGSGVVSKLPLRNNNRPVFTNANGSLVGVTVRELYDNTSGGNLGEDNRHNTWLNILGYNAPIGSTKVTESSLNSTPEVRQVGALLHSTPIILTQESNTPTRSGSRFSYADRKDYVLYGSTQGILHVVDAESGVEKLAFVPFEMVQNHAENFQPAEQADGTMTYGVDGQWTAYTQYIANGGKYTVKGDGTATSTNLNNKAMQWVYGGLRMGGRSYYALDLSDIDNPRLKFHINPETAGTGTPLSYMGQSWSKPTLGFVNWPNATTNKKERRLVMFVGGGYDEGYEDRTYTQTNGKGAGVYMFDAHTGDLLWWGSSHATTSTGTTHATNNADLKYSVAGNIATYDRNNDGFVDNLFFGDLGGQVFRVDIDNASNEPVSRIVRLYNGHQANGLSPRFYETPSFSVHSHDSYKDGGNNQFGVVSIASGNRSSPLAKGAESASDALFVIYDYDTLRKDSVKSTTTPLVSDASTDNLVTLTADIIKNNRGLAMNDPNLDKSTHPMGSDGARRQGWKYYLSPSSAGSLKGYSSPRVVDNFLFLNTYSPDHVTRDNECSAGIVGKSYQELFCMPTGICNVKQNTIIQPEGLINPDGSPDTNGSPYRSLVGIGIVNTAVGNAESGNVTNRVGATGPMIDCTLPANQGKLVCLNEVSNIQNKPVRWYENQPRTQ